MAEKQISIRDVAALAGVSVGSASRVINGAANVTPDVRERVDRAIAALRYRPNHAAQSLRSRTSKTIGCMFSDVANPLYARAFRALEEHFRREGYMLLLANGLNDAEREIDIIQTFQLRGMDGVILAPGNERHPGVLDAVRRLSMPAVIYDRDLAVEADAVLFDHVAGVKAAIHHLVELGHTRIALALWQVKSRPVRRRIEGYKAAFKAAGLPVPDLILQEPTPTSSAFDDVTRLLQLPDPPTAFLAQGTHTLTSTLRAIAKQGLRVPEDVSVIGIGDTDFAQTYDPPLTVLRTPTDEVAAQAVEMLLSRLAAKGDASLPPRKALIQFDLILRESCAPVARH
ncbi:MAG: LacI family transcriptional regulator [Burkholderiaceae bacterium]|jgi:LacI family transcriptional regulator|uniref:LacI family DNA-binding transcriptional regulator n=1 Tax=Cupriavidus metallidurans TaxID=119219 RepID=A0A482IZ76_9BURK|nr:MULTISPECIES: substrate-binding domain-containing protein [Cupriavidus]KWR79943.1 LacI family transcriptional regulator [Cupriavidus sp. SHE]PCH58601.1 MAG: LacI family transcriptional regulator [Burkholderiaceae bacterium]QBP12873.1 LacI family DNA-binding transcriptional regulator [Cupriavidus metallidurans]QWC90664.1 substrate-binding domain-containing protein [Cupriavidus metallidurans]